MDVGLSAGGVLVGRVLAVSLGRFEGIRVGVPAIGTVVNVKTGSAFAP
jgi:hypothetical protein